MSEGGGRECVEELKARFRSRALNARPELYLDRNSALEFVQACDAADAALIRVEAFLIQDGKLISSTELMSDYPAEAAPTVSWSEHRHACNEWQLGCIRATGTSRASDR